MHKFTENFALYTVKPHALFDDATAAAEQPSDNGIDLYAAGKNLPDAILLLIDVSVVASGASLKLVVEDSADGTTWDADFVTIEDIDAVGLYAVEIPNPNRHLRVKVDTLVDAVTFGIIGVTYNEMRRPVTHGSGVVTDLELTYGAGRTGKVATS